MQRLRNLRLSARFALSFGILAALQVLVAFAGMRQADAETRVEIAAISAVAVAASIAIAVMLTRDLQRRSREIVSRLTTLRERDVTDVTSGLEAIAAGDHTVAVCPVTPLIDDPGRDELGQIAESVNAIRNRTVDSGQAYEELRATLALALGPHSCLEALTARLASLTDGCMAEMEGALQRIAEGDLTVAVSPMTTPVTSADGEPVGQLGDVFNALLVRTENSVASYGQMREKVSAMLNEISGTSQTVAAASQQMASTSEEAGKAVGEIATAVGEVAHGAERQVRSVEAAREATREVSAAAQESAASAQETAQAAKQARDVAEQGAAAVDQATEAMSAVRESSAQATRAIRELGAKSEQIGGIVDTISGIAKQTNLLALNAAIEAARAGEQGRGFAVVAEEVRKLAEESQDAAASIARLIEEITAQTGRAVDVVETGGQQTHDGSATVERARESFLAIQVAIDDMNTRVEHIAANIQQIAASSAKMEADIGEVASVAEQSSASTEQVSASTQQTSASTQEIASSAQQLAGTAEELERLVGQFQLEAA